MTAQEKLDCVVTLIGDERMKAGQRHERYKRLAIDAATRGEADKFRLAAKMNHNVEIALSTLLSEVEEIVGTVRTDGPDKGDFGGLIGQQPY